MPGGAQSIRRHSGALMGLQGLGSKAKLGGSLEGGPESSRELSGRWVSRSPGAALLKQGPQKPSVWCMVINGYGHLWEIKGGDYVTWEATPSSFRHNSGCQAHLASPSVLQMEDLKPGGDHSVQRPCHLSPLPPCNPSSPPGPRGALAAQPPPGGALEITCRNEMLRHASAEF